MTITSPSPYARPRDGVRVVQGVPAPERPDRDTRDALEARLKTEAAELVESTTKEQAALSQYDLGWLKDRHVVLAGATGQGLGGALAAAIMPRLGEKGTLTAIARDVRFSLGYYSADALKTKAEEHKLGERFRFSDRGLALDGPAFDDLVATLKDLKASDVVYLNMVAAANSGVMPGAPPIYVVDVDKDGLFQWELPPLNDKQVELSRFVMGEMATQFPATLAKAGVTTAVEGYAGWRGSHDKISRLPEREEYGRQGAYSGSLWLPKDVLDTYIDEANAGDTRGRVVQVHMFPIMRTRALAFIPGGMAMAGVIENLMKREGIAVRSIPDLAMSMLDRLGKAVAGKAPAPWQFHDTHEIPLDGWFEHVVRRLTNDEASPYHFKKWIES